MNWNSNQASKARTKLPNLSHDIGKSGGSEKQKIWTISNVPTTL